MGVELLNVHTKHTLFFFDSSSPSQEHSVKQDDFYHEFVLNEHTFILNKNSIDLINKVLTEEEKMDYTESVHIPIRITNVGNGAAQVRVKISPHHQSISSKIYSTPPFFMPVNSTHIVRICSDSIQNLSQAYDIKFIYTDIFQNYYEDTYLFEIRDDQTTSLKPVTLQKMIYMPKK